MQTEIVEMKDAQIHLKELVDRVIAGTHVVLSDNKKPVAQLLPLSSRMAGLHAGAIWTSEDFDAPLSDEFWAAGK